MLDADPPVELGHGPSAEANVTAGVDGEVPQIRPVEHVRGAIDRPALDEPGRVEHARCVRIEVPARLVAQLLAALQDPADIRMRVVERQLATVETADLAVVPVRAERRVDPAEPVEHLVERADIRVVVTDVDQDRHAHDVLDSVDARNRGRCAHPRLAFRIADWSDCANDSLVYVAPEIMLTLALCAFSASLRRIGSAFWLMY
jgi:hypothetical protein